jgi:hypothetical protein
MLSTSLRELSAEAPEPVASTIGAAVTAGA